MEDNQLFIEQDIKTQIQRYFSFWYVFLISIIIFFSSAYIYLRYTNYQYESHAKIEIFDKAQDSEMALPTAMTVFNRSMVNLDNEIGVLNSFLLHEKVVKKLNSNIRYYSVGTIKTAEDYYQDWYKDYDFEIKVDPENISEFRNFDILIEDNKLIIKSYEYDESDSKYYSFTNLSTKSIPNHDLPFELTINKYDPEKDIEKKLTFDKIENIVDAFIGSFRVVKSEIQGDQLDLSLNHTNIKISEEYLNTLLLEFDNDGIVDRQLEYKRTIDFVDTRSGFLIKELEKIELRKQDFKQKNNLTDIISDANVNISQQYNYDAELFASKSQKDLVSLLADILEKNKYELMPANIGITSSTINDLIGQYNLLIRERERYLLSAGPKNPFILNIESQINDFSQNIKASIDNYEKSLDLKISSLEEKEKEFENFYKNIPENEKILRGIERELKVKESLFLLLLQKREEAAINFAVVKPSIKVIDYARSKYDPISPNKKIVYLASLVFSLFLPFTCLYIWFFLDTKIHTRKDLLMKLKDNIPLIGEIPHIFEKDLIKNIISTSTRHPFAEGIRMIIANLNFVLFSDNKKDRNNIILVTSSVKGEGKTVIAVNVSSILSSKHNKVLLIGADLRNPQIHNYLNITKDIKGVSDYISLNNLDWKDLVISNNNIDILLSGTIPPNPTELLSSKKFEELLNEAKNIYDYIVIDSAPCLLVSDTFEISKFVDTTLYIVRANFTDKEIINFINECSEMRRLSNMNVILNGLGNSSVYGYKYGYQYGYKYGYKYGYNYGYGYGYSED